MRTRGFTLIELLVVICVIAVTFGVALDRLLKYQELAERTAMEQNLAAINVALTLKFAALVASGRAGDVEAETAVNPAKGLARPPENYLGELNAPDLNTLPKGSWHFDLRTRELVYVPSRARFLTAEQGQTVGNLRFRVMLTEGGKDASGVRVLRQPYIAPVFPYRWAPD